MKAYKYEKPTVTTLKSVEKMEGEPLEWKIERIVTNNEPIKDGAPAIYTERKDGIVSAYNIRTDRWEIAAEAMDKVQANIQAKRDNKATTKEEKGKIVKLNKEDSGAESRAGTEAK
jgi:hypothetical protein